MGNNAEKWTMDDLVKLNPDELLKIFSSLEPPDPQEMDGEFKSRYPLVWEATIQESYLKTRPGPWFGKAYACIPLGRYPGQGYNIWHKKDGYIRNGRFAWSIANSDFDGKPSLVMRYDAFEAYRKTINLVDEIRRVKPGLYIGIFTTNQVLPPFTLKWKIENIKTAEMVFLLEGPVREWHGVDDENEEPVSQDAF